MRIAEINVPGGHSIAIGDGPFLTEKLQYYTANRIARVFVSDEAWETIESLSEDQPERLTAELLRVLDSQQEVLHAN